VFEQENNMVVTLYRKKSGNGFDEKEAKFSIKVKNE
jgi:hypothetical protein